MKKKFFVVTSAILAITMVLFLWGKFKYFPSTAEKVSGDPVDRSVIQIDRTNGSKKIKWAAVKLIKIFEIDSLLYVRWPQSCKVDQQGNVYVVDVGSYSVLKFDASGAFLTKWGRRGSGPGEFRGIVRGWLDVYGDYWISDAGNSRLVKFDPEGNYLKSIKLTTLSLNAVVLSDSTIVTTSLTQTPLARKFDAHGQKLFEFGENLTASHLINQGRLIADRNDRLFFSYDFASPILCYDKNGKLLYRIDGPVVIRPPREAFDDANYQLTGDEKFATLDMAVYGNRLYVLFSGVEPNNPQIAPFIPMIEPTESDLIHVYDIRDGKYLYSFKLPVLAKYIAVFRNRIYCVSYEDEVKIVAFRIESPKGDISKL